MIEEMEAIMDDKFKNLSDKTMVPEYHSTEAFEKEIQILKDDIATKKRQTILRE